MNISNKPRTFTRIFITLSRG